MTRHSSFGATAVHPCGKPQGILAKANKIIYFAGLAAFVLALNSFAVDHYVTPPGGYGTNNFPYTTWAEAATQIQWAVSAATNGETVWVTNGNYVLTNQIVITNGITLKSVNGWTNTVVDGNYPNTTNRCIYAVGSGIRRPIIDGFTITNGYAQSNDISGEGGGLWLNFSDIFNCLITGNRTAPITTNTAWGRGGGGGIFLGSGCTVLTCTVSGNYGINGGGIWASDLNTLNYMSNCVISANYAGNYGGATFQTLIIVNSIISNNTATNNGGGIFGSHTFMTNCVIVTNRSIASGGGALLYYESTIDGSVISNNVAGSAGGGVIFAPDWRLPVVKNSIIVNNSASYLGGGGIYAPNGGIIRQCLIKNNRIGANCSGAGILLNNFKFYTGYVDSCSIVSNTATGQGGGIAILGTNSNYSVSNCVVWGNIATNVGGNDLTDLGGPTNLQAFSWTCANYTNFAAGQGNITNDPRFVDFAGGNYRLAPESPCVNTGSNQNWMTNAVDFDGRRRILYGTVDMGAYEHIDEGTIYNIR